MGALATQQRTSQMKPKQYATVTTVPDKISKVVHLPNIPFAMGVIHKTQDIIRGLYQFV